MNKIKSFLSAYGVYLVILAFGVGAGFFIGRYNIVIISESEWDSLTKAQAQIIQFQADAELQTNLEGMK